MLLDVLAEIAKFDRSLPIERASMPPSSWYTASEIFDRERASVFARSWLPAVRADRVVESGSAISGCIAGEPWLITRDADGELRGFHNTCRHKGNLLVSEPVHEASELRCGYHGWVYGLDGRLQSAPRVAGIQDFDREALGLKPLAVREWGPWLFVNADPAATWLLSLSALGEKLGFGDLKSFAFAGSRSWELRCNWKVYVDNFLDGGYHISSIHPSLESQLDGASYRTTTFEGYSLQEAPPSTAGGERIGPRARYAFVYPNFMVNRYGGCLEGNIVTPLGVDRCHVDYDFFFDRAMTQADIDASIAESESIQEQDVAVSEAVQIGLSSSGFDRGRYAPSVEIAEHHFHRQLALDLTRG